MTGGANTNHDQGEPRTKAADTPDLGFSADGLIPAIVQDDSTGQVLMLAYMNRESLRRTLETGKTWFWSRSRNALWLKGETSGHYQAVKAIYVDCDNDALLIKVDQTGQACHEGCFSCFHREIGEGGEIVDAGSTTSPVTSAILDEVYRIVLQRKENPSKDSYVSRLMQSGLDRVLRKIGEEAAEFIIASKNDTEQDTVSELADLWFHSLVILAYLGIPVSHVYRELAGRRKQAQTIRTP